MTPSTKIELNHSKIVKLEDLDELAKVLFPGNKSHQVAFLAIFVELKWAPEQFLSTLERIADKHNISRRTLETVRAKMRRLGIIDHVSRFNRKHGYREGWVFSKRCEHSLEDLSKHVTKAKAPRSPSQEQKDRDAYRYL